MADLRVPGRPRGRRVSLRVNGEEISAYTGETLFAALTAAGIRVLRQPYLKTGITPASPEARTETARGGFCGMGVCQECRVTVNGRSDQRACMTEVRDGMEVSTDGP